MSDDLDPADTEQQLTTEPRNDRILVILGVIGVIGTFVGMFAVSVRFGIAIFTGVSIAFGNYFWMRRSLKAIFSKAEEGLKPKFIGAGYFLRYLVFGALIAVIYAADLLPISGILIGAAGFGFAVMIEAFIRIFSGYSGKKEI